jgi:hypothetical protein
MLTLSYTDSSRTCKFAHRLGGKSTELLRPTATNIAKKAAMTNYWGCLNMSNQVRGDIDYVENMAFPFSAKDFGVGPCRVRV